jgi:N-acetylglucosamine-6-phosphate deacetylase
MVIKLADYDIINATLVYRKKLIPHANIMVRRGIIQSITTSYTASPFPIIDAKSKIAGPGLIEMHIHGAGGVELSGLNIKNKLETMASFLEKNGITTFQPTMVLQMDILKSIQQALLTSEELQKKIPGVYLEGPFINPQRRGGIPLECVEKFSRDRLEEILMFKIGERSLVKTMTIAPEMENSDEATRILEEHQVLVAWGHSDAFIDQISGKEPRHITHLFNTMQGISHHRPGLAILPFLNRDRALSFEIIADGIHLHPKILEMIFSHPTAKDLCLISDCILSGTLDDSDLTYLGQDVVLDGKVIRYKQSGTLVGSASLITDTAKELYGKGLIDVIDFFRITSGNPARVLNLDDRGSIEVGKRADILLFEKDMTLSDVLVCVI